MKNKNVKGIIALVLVTALSFGVIAGSKALTTDNGENAGSNDNAAEITAELDTTGAEGIENAVKTTKGYEVTVRTAGFAGDIRLKVFFDEDAETITKVEVLEHTESEGYGAQIAEAEFLSRFEGVKAPVLLPGMTFGMESGKDEENKDEENNREDNAAKDAVFVDGTYTAVTTEPDDSGYTEELTMVVEGGKITSVVWDCVNAEGEKKSVLSEEGKYVMNPEGLTWKKQAEALAAVVVANQNVASVGMKEDGKTDAVSGVSIYVGGFAGLVEDCMAQAAGTAAETPTEPETPANGTMVDAVSGATVSSKAAINAINNAYKFLQSSGL